MTIELNISLEFLKHLFTTYRTWQLCIPVQSLYRRLLPVPTSRFSLSDSVNSTNLPIRSRIQKLTGVRLYRLLGSSSSPHRAVNLCSWEATITRLIPYLVRDQLVQTVTSLLLSQSHIKILSVLGHDNNIVIIPYIHFFLSACHKIYENEINVTLFNFCP